MEYEKKPLKRAVAAIRVSSTKQKSTGDSPEDQKLQIEMKAQQLGATIVKFFDFTQSASKNEQPFEPVVEYCKVNVGKIDILIFKSIDRFTRGGAYYYEDLRTRLAKYGVQIVDVHGVIGSTHINTLEHTGFSYSWSEFSPTRTSEILTAERGKDEVRDILTRMIGSEIRYTNLGFNVREANYGYKNEKVDTIHGKRTIAVPDPIESPFVVKIFEMRSTGNLSDKEIVKAVNDLGFKSRKIKARDSQRKELVIGNKGEKTLTVKQMQKWVQNPIYAGIKVEKWTNGKPVKASFPGLVTIELFNKANKGKVQIHEENGMFYIYKGQVPQWQKQRNRQNPEFPFRGLVLCPKCKKPLTGSFSRGKLGKRHPGYHCNRNHYYRVNRHDFDETIESFVQNISFGDAFKSRFKEVVIEQWNLREQSIAQDTITYGQRLVEIESELLSLKERLRALSSPTAIKMFEDDIDKLTLERAHLIQQRDNSEDSQLNIQELMNYASFFMEHLHKLLLNADNPIKGAEYFGLLFDELPTYTQIVNGTPTLSCLFKLNEEYKKNNSLLVTPRGIEPLLTG